MVTSYRISETKDNVLLSCFRTQFERSVVSMFRVVRLVILSDQIRFNVFPPQFIKCIFSENKGEPLSKKARTVHYEILGCWLSLLDMDNILLINRVNKKIKKIHLLFGWLQYWLNHQNYFVHQSVCTNYIFYLLALFDIISWENFISKYNFTFKLIFNCNHVNQLRQLRWPPLICWLGGDRALDFSTVNFCQLVHSCLLSML